MQQLKDFITSYVNSIGIRMQKRVTANGTEHGLLNTLINQVPKSKRFKNVEPKLKEELEKIKKT
jgi:hypothetical protein